MSKSKADFTASVQDISGKVLDGAPESQKFTASVAEVTQEVIGKEGEKDLQKSSKEVAKDGATGLWDMFKKWFKNLFSSEEKGSATVANESSQNTSKEEGESQDGNSKEEQVEKVPQTQAAKQGTKGAEIKGEEKGSTLTEEEAAVAELLQGIKSKANGNVEKETEMLKQVSDLVVGSKDQELMKQWADVSKSLGEKDSNFKDMTENLSGKISGEIKAQEGAEKPQGLEAAMAEVKGSGVFETLREGAKSVFDEGDQDRDQAPTRAPAKSEGVAR
ncbi:MAG: hypothetical protein KA100_04970 [Rickettsiales bacterium]|nr:hypothetical protein [Rickettsiales bacterium]